MANDYIHILFDRIQNNNKVYSELIDKYASKRGITKNGNWTWCLSTNSTYMDCPISNYERDQSFIVAVHNPALEPKKVSVIKTAHGNYTV